MAPKWKFVHKELPADGAVVWIRLYSADHPPCLATYSSAAVAFTPPVGITLQAQYVFKWRSQ